MSTFYWIILIYLLSVFISLPFVRRAVREGNETWITNKAMTWIISWTPILNMYVGYLGFRIWIRHKMAIFLLNRASNKLSKVKRNPEIDEILKNIAKVRDSIKENNTLKEE